MKRKKNFKKVLVYVISLTVALFLVSPGYAKELLPMKVAYLPLMDLLQLYIGLEKGFFEEEGLKVEPQIAQGGAVCQTLVESGSVDLGWTAIVPLSQAYVKGFDFIFVAPGSFSDSTNRRNVGIIVRKDSPYQSFKDLAGKKIALLMLKAVPHLGILVAADFYGVDANTLKLVEIPLPSMVAALKEGAVDAAHIAEPFIAASEAEGITRLIFTGYYPPEIADRIMPAGWFAKRSSLEKNKEKLGRFLKAINRATDYINRNPDEMPAIVAKYTKLDVNLLKKVTPPRFYTKTYKKDIQIQIDLCAKYGFINKRFDAREIVADFIPLD
jgi:NitT/TauT family transport system substrate-binding protein